MSITGNSAFDDAAEDMARHGYSLEKIKDVGGEHIWEDGLLLFWHFKKRLPTAWELAVDMFDEWDDPVGEDEAQEVLNCLTS